MPNASIPTPEPIKTRKMFGAYGKAVGENSVIFVSKAAGEGIKAKYGINKRAVPVKNCRSLSKRDMVLNDFLPEITVNAENYEVPIEKDGKRELLTCQLTDSLLPNDTFFSN
ncbi:putative urease isoform X4 [Apostichopus japonicus]|uniref:Putative urease isoform X4 n=1 Tax=Stichopus japonicus TaxID=307972 RepID=A0A2G8JJJ3_STIJA|nr:putative urease isoform X4 [Apostichopus japonicus]